MSAEPAPTRGAATTANGRDRVQADLAFVEHRPGVPKPDAIVVADDVTRHFGGMTAVDVDHLEIQRGAITALIGPNGAGKTTLFNLLTGFDKPSTGRWTFEGRSLSGVPAAKVARVATCVVSWLTTTWAPRGPSPPKTRGLRNTCTGVSGFVDPSTAAVTAAMLAYCSWVASKTSSSSSSDAGTSRTRRPSQSGSTRATSASARRARVSYRAAEPERTTTRARSASRSHESSGLPTFSFACGRAWPRISRTRARCAGAGGGQARRGAGMADRVLRRCSFTASSPPRPIAASRAACRRP